MKRKKLALLMTSTIAMLAAGEVHAQSSLTLYGVMDVFAGYQSANVGGKSTSLYVLGNNGELTSRWGLRGSEDMGGGYRTTFDLENGFDPGTGKQQNPYRFFDRQAWVGVAAPYGEFRFGRQNSPMFAWSGNLDAFGAATYGSGFNNFANWQARVDNDISYISPRLFGTQLEAHYSVGGQPGSLAGNAVYQIGVQSTQGPVYLAAAYLNAANATNSFRVQEIMAGGNVDYGWGRIYLGWFRANDVISATTGNALANPAGKYDPATGPVGNTPGDYHTTWSLSADYRFSPFLSVGAGYAYIKDSSSLGNDASQMSAIVNYDLSKTTRLYGVVSRLNNDKGAQYKMAGASITTGTFLTPDRGQNETGVQIGLRHLF
ncbi:Outer membrane porin protein 32 [Paraburkholderia saeva]|uniref:Outer membrane porin protein 32 n=2 Tax=Paraburkholderia saeva TaxID=2777537 RepID=A0A9N8RVY6_9BURK|nr:Outer membrane porin protein 32 [Paraburkholderia saeva]CAG4893455.1 Outer membrane porin protein 32 [Paraburkholderia saeva]CAG4895818.1 Outer membrane porin protein 32 [Paraburkholderia saeva]